MLFRKMLREFKANFGPFFSVFLLATIAMMLFITMEGHVVSQNVARGKYHDACNLSDIWMYGEGDSECTEAGWRTGRSVLNERK